MLPQCLVILVCVAVRPTIDCDRGDVTRRIKPCTAEHRCKLAPDVALDLEKWRSKELPAAGAVLLLWREPVLGRRTQHKKDHGIIRRGGRPVAAHVHRI